MSGIVDILAQAPSETDFLFARKLLGMKTVQDGDK